jgi:hypothetical protein
MTGPRPRSGVASILTLLVTAALLAGMPPDAGAVPAPASDPAPERPGQVVVVRAGHHFPSSVDVTTPAGGQAEVTSPTLDKSTTQVQVTVAVDKQAEDAEKRDFLRYSVYLSGLKTPGQRLLACIALHHDDLSTWNMHTAQVEIEADNADRAFMLLLGCMRIAQLIAEIEANVRQVSPAVAERGQSCAKGPRAFPATESHDAGGYHLDVSGAPTKAKKGGGVKIKCTAFADKMVYTVRPKKRGKTLRSIYGPQLSFGMQSPMDAEAGSVTTRVTFSHPK